MGYYQGDYYQGDYYQGDPFLGIGTLLGLGVTWLGKKLLGKAAVTAGTTAIARVGAGAATGLTIGGAIGSAIPFIPSIAKKGVEIFGSLRTRLPSPAPMAQAQAMGGGCCPTGYHFNKQISYGKNTFGALPGTFCVKNRSMNVANPRALRRGLRRTAGFGKLAQRAKKDIRRAAKSIGA